MAAGATFWADKHRTSAGVRACNAVTEQMVHNAFGATLPSGVGGPIPSNPSEKSPPGATICSYGSEGGLSATVFAWRHGASSYYAEVERFQRAEGNPPIDISGQDYSAFTFPPTSGGGPSLQTFFLLKHGQYINALVFDARPGAATKLARLVAIALP